MSRSVSVPGAAATSEVDGPRVPGTRGPPPGRAGDSVAMILRLAEDHDRIAAGMNDIVVHRLFSAGLSLQTALGMIGDHPAARKVQEAIGELDAAIRDFRNVLFDHHHPESPPGRQRG